MSTPALTNQIATDIANMQLLLTEKGSSVSGVATSGTGEDNLSSISITAGDLNNTGSLSIQAAGYSVGNNGRRCVRLYFGSKDMVCFDAGISGSWIIDATIMCISTASQSIIVNSYWSCNGVNPYYSNHSVRYYQATEDTTSTITVKCTGECSNSGDWITQCMMLVRQTMVG